VTEPRFRDSRRTLKRPAGGDVLSDELLEQEIRWRKWFPKDLKFSAKGMSDDDVERVIAAFTAFCEDNVWVKIPGGRELLTLRPAQIGTLRAMVENRDVIILKARQIGFSTLLAAFTLWCAMSGSDRQIYMLSKGQREARALLSKARYAYRNLPDWVQSKGPKLLDRTLERMSFENDSYLVSSQSASDPIRGETAWMAIVDEWASIADQEGAWAAIEPTADVGGRIIGLSTAKGAGDFFHSLWVGAETGNNQFTPVFHSWRAVPDRDDRWYADKKANNPIWFVSQEYPDNPEEAFIGSGNPFFDLDIVRGWNVKPVSGMFDPQFVDGVPSMVVDGYGDFAMWKEPSPKLAYAIGADIAMGLDHGDWSVAWVMEAKTREIVGLYRGHCHPDVFGEHILPAIGLYYNEALICPEVNNHGLTTITAMMRRDYPNIYRRRTRLKRRETVTESMGWMTTVANKTDMCNKIDVWMRDGHQTYDELSMAELKTFVREQRGDHISLHGSPHDDMVMALGLTLVACQYAQENNLLEPKLSDAGSIRWWESQLSKKSSGSRKRLSPVF
jgi:hypothetical protein